MLTILSQAYISGNAIAILSDHDTLLQTIYDDDDQPLEGVAFDEVSGKIAACTRDTVRIYRPFSHEDGVVKWALEASFVADVDIERADDGVQNAMSLSWGASDELLVSRSALALYQVTDNPSCTWRKPLASRVKYAELSYDSAYIASVGYRDRLVKVWRRLSYVSDDICFDFLYLPHPQTVTSLQWRKPYHYEQTVDNVLYTFCADNILRIWTGSDSHSHQQLQLWGKVDLAAAQGAPPCTLWATIIHGRDFSAAVETAVQEGATDDGKKDGMLENVVKVANRNPEICIVFDGRGVMSAWAMENVGSKSQAKSTNIVQVAHVKSNEFKFIHDTLRLVPHVEISTYCNKPGGHLSVLLNFFDGRIEFCEANIARFLDPNVKSNRLKLNRVWSGHSAAIVKMVRNYSGRAVVSRTSAGESVVWSHALSGHNPKLHRQSIFSSKSHIHRICLLRKGRFVVLLHHDSIGVWDCRKPTPSLLAQCEYTLSGKPLCLLILPRQRAEEYSVAHIATITSDKKGVVWELNLPPPPSSTNGHAPSSSIREFYRFTLENAGDLAYVLPVDPAGSTPVVSGFLDVFARDVAISYTHSGRVEFWTARVGKDRVEWLSTSSMETGITEPALVSGSTMKKAALVNSSRSAVTIWDIRGARLEYNQEFESQNAVQDLDWTSTPDSQSILAIGFPSRILLLAEMRFDYLNKGPAWAPIREINIRDFTPHPIGDSTWLGDGNLVIGAGHQLYVYDRKFDASGSLMPSLQMPQRKDGMWDLFEVVQRLNGPLPVLHPQFLSQCILAGKIPLVHRILMSLHKILKFWVEGDVIDDYVGLDMEEFYIEKKVRLPSCHDPVCTLTV